jgi:DNA-binding SARP family transcriptional activator
VPGGPVAPKVSQIASDHSEASFRLLGRIEVCGAGKKVEVSGALLRSLLVRLLINAGRPVPSDVLAEDVWGEPVNPGSIRVLLSRLRALLADVDSPVEIINTPGGYKVELNGAFTDCDRFNALASEVDRTTDPRKTIQLATEAIALWTGQPFAEFGDQPWATTERERLLFVERSLRIRLALSYTSISDHQRALAEYEHLRSAHPYDESITGSMARGLWRAGRRNEALNEIAAMRKAMASELGLSLGNDLNELERQLFDDEITKFEEPSAAHPRAEHPKPASNKPKIVTRFPPSFDRTPFTGRELLRGSLLLRSEGQQPKHVVLTGPGGIGKSRLAHELSRSAEAQGSSVFTIRFDRFAADPYQPFFDGVPGLTEALEQEQQNQGDERFEPPKDHRVRVADELLTLLSTQSNNREVLLVTDDVQFAGSDVLFILVRVLRSSLPGLQVIATCRTTTTHDERELPQSLQELSREGWISIQEVSALSTDEMHLLLRSVAPNLADKQLEALTSKADGVPYFAVELGRAFASGEERIPASLAALFQQRIDSCPAELEKLLGVASQIGRSFDHRLAAAVAGIDEEPALKAFDTASETGLLIAHDQSQDFAFDHDLLREHAHERLTSARRELINLKIAEHLAANRAEFQPTSTRLAQHFSLAGFRGRSQAIFYLLASARDLLDSYAYQAAIDAATQAETFSREQADHPSALKALMLRGWAESNLGQLDASGSTFLRATDLARELGEHTTFVEAAIATSGFWINGSASGRKPAQLLTEAALLPTDPAMAARAKCRLAAHQLVIPDADVVASAASIEESLLFARRCGDVPLLADCLGSLNLLLLGSNSAQRRLELAAEVRQLPYRSMDGPWRMGGYPGAIVAHKERGEEDHVDENLLALELIASETDRLPVRWRAETLRASVLISRREFVDGMTYARKARESARLMSFQDGEVAYALQTFQTRWMSGKLDRMLPAMNSVLDQPNDSVWIAAAAVTFASCEKTDDALKLIDQASTRIPSTPQYVRAGLCVLLEESMRLVQMQDDTIAYQIEKSLAPLHGTHITLGEGTMFLGERIQSASRHQLRNQTYF